MDLKVLFVSEEAYFAFFLGQSLVLALLMALMVFDLVLSIIRKKMGLPDWRYVAWVKQESKLPPKAE